MKSPSVRKGLSVSELAGALQRMEDKIDNLMAKTTANHGVEPLSDRNHPSSTIQPPNTPNPVSPISAFTPSRLGSVQIRQELAIPERHYTAPQHLLTWSCSPLTLNDRELRYPVDLEIKQARLRKTTAAPVCLSQNMNEVSSSWLSAISLSQLRDLANLYFTHFHPQCLVLDEDSFYHHHLSRTLRVGFDDSLSSCVVLLVLSLGSVVACQTDGREWAQSDSATDMLEFEAGLSFFNLACSIFRDVEDVSWESVQCLLLIAFDKEEQLRAHHCQLYWIAYLQESQILVEFEIPSSGLSGLESSVPLPLLPDPGTDPRQKEYQFFFLALVSMRRLLNRIHSHLYNQERLVTPTPSVLYELNRQIEEWRQCLFSAFQFSDLTLSDEVQIASQTDKRSMVERLKGHLKARYHAAKTILYRPHVHRMIHSSGIAASDYEVECAKTAIASAPIGILHGGIMHEPFQLLLFPINSWR
ncbi:C6 zinc finger protein, partial [Colletotrichum asianum]